MLPLDARFKEDTWEKLVLVARDHGLNINTKSKLRHYANQWKWKVLKLQRENKRPTSKAEKYMFQIYDWNEEINRLDESDTSDLEEETDIPEEARLNVVKMVESESNVLYQKTKGKSNFWTTACDEIKTSHGVRNLNGYLLRKHFWQWKKSAMQNDSLNIKPTQSEELVLKVIRQLTISNNLESKRNNEELKAAVLQQMFQNQSVPLFGNTEEKVSFWNSVIPLANKYGMGYEDGQHLRIAYNLWKGPVLRKLELGHYTQLRACDRMILELCIGPHEQMLSPNEQDSLIPGIQESNETLRNGDAKAKLAFWDSQIEILQGQGSNIPDGLTLYKLVNKWKLLAVKKQEFEMDLTDNDMTLIDSLGLSASDAFDADLLSHFEDSSPFDLKMKVFFPDRVKALIISRIFEQQELYFSPNPIGGWTELVKFAQDCGCLVAKPQSMARCFYGWTLEAWRKQVTSGGYGLATHESMMLEIAFNGKTHAHYPFNDNLDVVQNTEMVDLNENVVSDVVEDMRDYRDLLRSDKPLFWSMVLRMVQAMGVSCDNVTTIFLTFQYWRLKAQHKIVDQLPLPKLDRDLLILLDFDIPQEQEDDDGEDFLE